MAYWLLKSEPDVYAYADLVREILYLGASRYGMLG